jgi:hypothetical protein
MRCIISTPQSAPTRSAFISPHLRSSAFRPYRLDGVKSVDITAKDRGCRVSAQVDLTYVSSAQHAWRQEGTERGQASGWNRLRNRPAGLPLGWERRGDPRRADAGYMRKRHLSPVTPAPQWPAGCIEALRALGTGGDQVVRAESSGQAKRHELPRTRVYPITTSTEWTAPSRKSGSTQPATFSPSTVMLFTPLLTRDGFLTVIA